MGILDSAKSTAALKQDRRHTDQNDQVIELLTALIVEQRRTNQLLEWQGQHMPAHATHAPQRR